MKKFMVFLCAILLSFYVTGHVQAITVTDVYLDDLNVITGTDQDDANSKLTINEDYNEDNLIPYPSHDGYAIVDHDPGEPVRFFDKVFDLEGETGVWKFDFVVHNTTSCCWSDYHFEFWNEDFTVPYSNFPLLAWGNDIFQNSSFDDSVLQFWVPNEQCPSVTNDFWLDIDLDQITIDPFGIRQVATVPEPCTLLLLGTGLAGIVRYRKKFRKN